MPQNVSCYEYFKGDGAGNWATRTENSTITIILHPTHSRSPPKPPLLFPPLEFHSARFDSGDLARAPHSFIQLSGTLDGTPYKTYTLVDDCVALHVLSVISIFFWLYRSHRIFYYLYINKHIWNDRTNLNTTGVTSAPPKNIKTTKIEIEIISCFGLFYF